MPSYHTEHSGPLSVLRSIISSCQGTTRPLLPRKDFSLRSATHFCPDKGILDICSTYCRYLCRITCARWRRSDLSLHWFKINWKHFDWFMKTPPSQRPTGEGEPKRSYNDFRVVISYTKSAGRWNPTASSTPESTRLTSWVGIGKPKVAVTREKRMRGGVNIEVKSGVR